MLFDNMDARLLRPERIRKLTRAEFGDMVALGMFEDEHVELLRGELVEMSPSFEPHSALAAWLAQVLIKALAFARYDVRAHSDFAATKDSQPEPDVSVYRRMRRDDHPDVALLLIEVAFSSLRKDRTLKNEIYAEAGVPEYWIVNVRDQVVEVLTDPAPRGYRKRRVFAKGDILRPQNLPRIRIPVASMPWFSKAEIARAQRVQRERRKRIAAKAARTPKPADSAKPAKRS